LSPFTSRRHPWCLRDVFSILTFQTRNTCTQIKRTSSYCYGPWTILYTTINGRKYNHLLLLLL
jgi:hypothetical protein